MTVPVRVSASEVRIKSRSGEALLVCAYEDTDKFEANHLEGAIAWQTFDAMLPKITKGEEIIFYCA